MPSISDIGSSSSLTIFFLLREYMRKGVTMKFVDRFRNIEGVTSAVYHIDTMELEVRHKKGVDKPWLRIMIADKIGQANLQNSVTKVTLMEVD